jgi:hypothetical protein
MLPVSSQKRKNNAKTIKIILDRYHYPLDHRYTLITTMPPTPTPTPTPPSLEAMLEKLSGKRKQELISQYTELV